MILRVSLESTSIADLLASVSNFIKLLPEYTELDDAIDVGLFLSAGLNLSSTLSGFGGDMPVALKALSTNFS